MPLRVSSSAAGSMQLPWKPGTVRVEGDEHGASRGPGVSSRHQGSIHCGLLPGQEPLPVEKQKETSNEQLFIKHLLCAKDS